MFIVVFEGESYLLILIVFLIEFMVFIKIVFIVKVFDCNLQEMGLNGWGLGSDKIMNGKGMVLGNLYFLYIGNLCFWNFYV